MAKNANYVSHKKSKLKNQDGSPQLPSASALVEGEIAINFAENVETLSIKNESGDVVTFSSDNYYTERKLGSGFTGANSAVTVTDALNSLEVGEEVEVNSGDTPTRETIELWIDESIEPVTVEVYTKAETNALLTEKVNISDIVTEVTSDNSGSTAPIATKVVAENELTVSNALTDLDGRKLDASAYTPTDLSNYYTKSETSGKTEISDALDAKAAQGDLNTLNNTVTAHTADTAIHVTAAEKTIWNANGYYGTCATSSGTAAKTVDITGFTLNENKQVSVLFTNAFTVSSPTLNVSNTGAKPIMLCGEAIPMENVNNNTILTMIYDGTNYNVISIESQTVPTQGAVDLGLPSGILWCDHNVGASTPEEEGYFFSWGNVSGHCLNGVSDYNFGTSNSTEPYVSSSGATITYPGSIAVGDAYDMARANMGGNWRLPTNIEFQELYGNCTWTWTSVNSMNGYRVTSKTNSNSIFLPAAGNYNGSSHYYEGSSGYYWSSVLYSADNAYYLGFSSGGVYPQYYNYRYYGFSVRAVQ